GVIRWTARTNRRESPLYLGSLLLLVVNDHIFTKRHEPQRIVTASRSSSAARGRWTTRRSSSCGARSRSRRFSHRAGALRGAEVTATTSILLKALCIFALTFGAIPSAVSQVEKPARAEVLVLGVYHMANPGHDIFNMQADDVLAPKRQAEIAQVIAALKKFNPTKIALEAD